MTTTASLKETDFSYVQKLVFERSAIVLEATKAYLVESRLLPVARNQCLATIEELVARLRAERAGGLHEKVVEAMTTNETTFFRDVHPFEAMRTVIVPDLIERRAAARSLQVWCAACSSGQEPYSLAMLLREHFPALAGWAVRILATDLSTEMLDRARAGQYSQLEINRGLPATYLVKYLQKVGVQWRVNDDLRKLIDFRPLNLAGEWPALAVMDIVFIRNVLIYFDTDTKRVILGKIRNVLRPDGYLFLGGAETTINLDDTFERVQYDKASCYRLRTK